VKFVVECVKSRL